MNEIYYVVYSLQSEKRFKHTIGVVESAKLLAEIYNVDSEKCELAALLHDVTKQFNPSSQKKLLRNVDDKSILNNSALWHSCTGAIYSKNVLGIEDEDILNAIKFHTTGSTSSNEIAKIIYICDYLEPSRKHETVTELRKKIGKVSLDQLYNLVAINKIEYEINRGNVINQLTQELYESII